MMMMMTGNVYDGDDDDKICSDYDDDDHSQEIFGRNATGNLTNSKTSKAKSGVFLSEKNGPPIWMVE